jgi:hypothetical protein
VLAAALFGLSVVGHSALAAPGGLVSVPDGDDTPVVLDISQLDVQQNKDKRIQAKFSFYESFSASDLAAARGTPGSVCLRVYTGTTVPSSQPPQFLACVTATASGKRFRGTVLKETADTGNALKRAGALTVTHPDSHTLILRFTPAVIGSPKTMRFAGEATQQAGCPQPQGCFDRVPNSVRTRAFTLAA